MVKGRLQAVKAKHVGVGDWFGVLTDANGRPGVLFFRVLSAKEGQRVEGSDGFFRPADIHIELDGCDEEVCRPNDRVMVCIPGA